MLAVAERLPAAVLRPDRRRRDYLSAVLPGGDLGYCTRFKSSSP